MSNIIIVDDQDREIGIKKRSEVNYATDIYRCSTIWIVNSQTEVLIAQRSFKKDKDPGKWGPAVAGTIDEGETYESNAYKETGEEIGLTVNHLVEGPKVFLTTSNRKRFCQLFLYKTDKALESFKIQEEEVEKLEWVEQKELLRRVKDDPDKFFNAMPQLIQILYEDGKCKFI